MGGPSTQEVETGRFRVQGQLGVLSESLSKNKQGPWDKFEILDEMDKFLKRHRLLGLTEKELKI